MKKILFIIPPANFLTDQRVFPNLGLLRLATYMNHKGFGVHVMDLSGNDDYLAEITNWLANNYVDYIGITATTPQMPEAFKIAELLKPYKTILGGPHATMTVIASVKGSNDRSKNSLEDLKNNFTHIVAGDGELAMEQILLGNIKEQITNVETTPHFLTKDDYERLPMADRELIDIESYHYTIDGKKSTSLIWQQGCPFGCGFCGGRLTKTYRTARSCSVDKIIHEIGHLHKTYDYTGFMLYDDELNLNRANFIEYMDKIIKYQHDNHTEFSLRGFIRADIFDNEIANYMYKAGFRWVLCGFESGSDRLLENMNKHNTVEANTECAIIARQNKLKVKALMSIGHPGESTESVMETQNWLAKIKPDDFDMSIICVYPGTPYYDKSIKINDQTYKYTAKSGDNLYSLDVDTKTESLFYKSKTDAYQSYVYTDYLTRQQIVESRKNMEINIRKIIQQ